MRPVLCLFVALACLVGSAAADPITDYALFGNTSLNVGAGANVNGQIGSNGSVTTGSNVDSEDFGGGGNSSSGAGSMITGNVIVNGTYTTGSNVDVTGSIDASGFIFLNSGSSVGGIIHGGNGLSTGTNVDLLSNVFVTGNFFLGAGGLASGNVTATGTIGGTGTIAGIATAGAGSVPAPTPFMTVSLPAMSVFTAGGAAVTAGTNVNFGSLAPGSYGAMSLSSGASITLSAGNYFFSSITTGSNVTITLDLTGGPVNIYVTGNAGIGAGTDLVLVGGGAANVYTEVKGQFTTGSNVTWYGTVFTPMGLISVGAGLQLFGSLYAGTTLATGSNLNLRFVVSNTFENFANPPPLQVPEPGLALLCAGAAVLVWRLRRRAA